MNRHVASSALFLIVLVSAAAPARQAHGDNDRPGPPGEIAFEASNLLATARGRFRQWRIIRADIDEQNPARSVVVVEIDIASIDTGIGWRDAHLRSDDYFDVERFPTAIVELRDFSVTDPAHVVARVTLRIRDVERRFPMEFEIVDREARKVTATTTVSRGDFGVGGPSRRWNPMSVKDEVEVRVEALVPPASE